MMPGGDASLFDLIGQLQFTGGTGDFTAASGFASLIAHGRFVSALEATTQFEFDGAVASVPEPGTALLGLVGLLGLRAVAIRRAPARCHAQK